MTSLMLTLAVSLTLAGQVSANSNEGAVQSPATAVAAAEGTPDYYLPPPESREPVERTLRGFHQYSEEVQKWFKQQATAEKPGEQTEAIVALCALYHELRTDPRYPTSDALQQMKIKIWSRLTKIKREVELELARNADPTAADALAASSDAEQLTSLTDVPQAKAFGGGAKFADYGDDLVNLIERTIAPTKWDVNGGPFTIVYYAPLHALVVRASSEVHGNVGGLLGGLRQAGN